LIFVSQLIGADLHQGLPPAFRGFLTFVNAASGGIRLPEKGWLGDRK
jgi:hypothetical protein